MPRPDLDLDQDAFDAQDRAETLDETHLTGEAAEFATLEEAPDVFDSTQAEGDADEDDALALDADELDLDDLDADDVDEDDRETGPDAFQPEVEWAEAAGEARDDADNAIDDALQGDEIEGLDAVGDADSVEGGEDDFTNFQSKRLSDEQLNALGYAGRKSSNPSR